MLFIDLYVGVPPGLPYPDYVEILRFESRMDSKDFYAESEMYIQLESDMDKEIESASRIYT